MSLEYWYMFPVSVLVATVAMASGVEGATFFTPLFILALGIPTKVAIATGLIAEVFGFSSGLFSYARRRLIDYRLGRNLIVVTIPMALFGTWVSRYLPPDIVKVVLGVGLFAVAMSFLRRPYREDIFRIDQAIETEYGGPRAERCLTPAGEKKICYKVCNRTEGRMVAAIGATFVGLVSTGLGELNDYFLLQRCKVPSKVSIATSVFTVVITSGTASVGHAAELVLGGGLGSVNLLASLLIFVVPGVIIGGQVGPFVAARVPERVVVRTMGILFALVGALMVGGVIWKLRGG